MKDGGKVNLTDTLEFFPDNYVEEISSTTNIKHRPNTPEIGAKHSSKAKLTNDDSSHNYPNDSPHNIKLTSNNDEKDQTSRDHYTKISNVEKSNEMNKQKMMPAKRPPSSSITKKKMKEQLVHLMKLIGHNRLI